MNKTMRRAILGLLAIASVAAPAIARPYKTQLLVPASLVKPVDALHRTCGGACLKSEACNGFAVPRSPAP